VIRKEKKMGRPKKQVAAKQAPKKCTPCEETRTAVMMLEKVQRDLSNELHQLGDYCTRMMDLIVENKRVIDKLVMVPPDIKDEEDNEPVALLPEKSLYWGAEEIQINRRVINVLLEEVAKIRKTVLQLANTGDE
jgi:hypothetical protein